MPKKKYTTVQKRNIITQFIETLVMNGYDISEMVGRPLSFYDYEKLQTRTDVIRAEYQQEPIDWKEVLIIKQTP